MVAQIWSGFAWGWDREKDAETEEQVWGWDGNAEFELLVGYPKIDVQ